MMKAGIGRQALLVAAAALCAAGPWPALHAGEEAASVEARIRSANEEMREALRRGDGDKLLEMYTPDARLVMAGKTISGREDIGAYIAFAFGAGVRDVRLDQQELFVGDGVAVETGRAVFSNAAGTALGTSRYMTLWKESGGRWRIHRDLGVPTPGVAPAAQGAFAFAIKQVEPLTAVVLPMTGSFAQHGEAIARVAVSAGSSVAGAPFGRYYNSPESVAESELKWEVGFPVSSGASVEAPIERRDFAAETVAFAVVPGPLDGSRPWPQLIEWVVAQGYEITGPAMEIWTEGPKTEMRIPVRKTGSK